MAQPALNSPIHCSMLVHHPQQLAAWHRGAGISAAQFYQDVAKLAAQLPEAGQVVNLCEDRYHFAVSFAAAIVRQQVTLMPSNNAPGAVNSLLNKSRDGYCLTDQLQQGIQARQLLYTELLDAENSDSIALPEQIEADRQVAILYTSGSTGTPKPNPKSWGELKAEAESALQRFPFLSRSVSSLVATVPAQHMYGLATSIFFPWQGGIAVHTGRPLFPADIAADLALTSAPRVLISTPLHLRACLDAGISWPEISFIISATAPLSRELAAEAEQQLQTELYEIYGSTETGSIASRRTAKEESWTLYDGIEMTQQGNQTYASGGHLPHPVLLNDNIEILNGGRFRLLGRNNDMLKIAGKRASIGDLNQKLLAIPGVIDGIFVPPEDPNNEKQRLTALVVAPSLSKQEILHQLAQSIDAAFLPRPLHFVTSLPRNSTGKLPREQLIDFLKAIK
ncbi:MAG: AMP-binding protein [Candidatus Thiodiazotropha lotti]|nr:AMP-binding protein [Candidatus Thiodiazotropha lotti]MCG8005342.1 AMP-binding protein [Candidatus Thiodiazotropha lotti]MCG8009862.1 AMP-binding protein [Candidatus Thiodiazotropha lotti]MCW4188969.1 AMP-binding protein [Candidatus Thiodiazotropha lotti]MCW4197456.1 AMP-binding protein [Candidatus Thiodiazotropha lotti]